MYIYWRTDKLSLLVSKFTLMKFTVLLYSIIFLSCFSKKESLSVSDLTDNQIRLTINFHLNTCDGEGRQFCFLVKGENDENWQNQFEYIENFDFEWGYIYEVIVEKKKKEFPSFDGTTHTYKLVKILDKKSVNKNTSFQLNFDRTDLKNELEQYYLINNIKIEFDSSDLLDKILNANESQLFNGEFLVGESSNTIRLINLN